MVGMESAEQLFVLSFYRYQFATPIDIPSWHFSTKRHANSFVCSPRFTLQHHRSGGGSKAHFTWSLFVVVGYTLIILHNNSRKNMLRLQLQSQLPSPLSLTVLHVAHKFRIVCIFFVAFFRFGAAKEKKEGKKRNTIIVKLKQITYYCVCFGN